MKTQITPSIKYRLGYRQATKEKYKSDLELAQAIGSFFYDPADTDFQYGYLTSLKARFVKMQAMKSPKVRPDQTTPYDHP